MRYVIALAIALGLGLLFAWPVMFLLNYVFVSSVLSAVFGAVHVTFWKAYALSILTSLLFKSNR